MKDVTARGVTADTLCLGIHVIVVHNTERTNFSIVEEVHQCSGTEKSGIVSLLAGFTHEY